MKNLLIIFSLILLFSCQSSNNQQNDSLKDWINHNHVRLKNDIDKIIQKNLHNHKPSPDWLSSSIVITMFAPNSLGTLAKIAGDSTNCVVVELTFYKDDIQKREIMIAAVDSSCIKKINSIKLERDSIDNLIFGKQATPLY